jgi:RimJ/RimL family protein N-acetyltransferase
MEDDWDILLVWNNDPEVLFYSEGGDITSWTLSDMKELYRGVSQGAYVFMAELDGRPIGECWLQKMNLERVKKRYPKLDVRRIDLVIGEKDCWGKGWGTRIIRLLTCFAFKGCGIDILYEPEIADYNPRSRRAFEKSAFVVEQVIPQAEGFKAVVAYDMILTSDAYEMHRGRESAILPPRHPHP